MAHEDLKREQEVKGGSDRSFGVVFGVVFLAVALWPVAGGGRVRLWAVTASAVILAVAAVRPGWLAAPNRLWMRFGLLANRVVSPVALGIVYYLAVTPTGLILRLLGKDPLRLRFDPKAASYWIPREPPGPPPGSMSNPF